MKNYIFIVLVLLAVFPRVSSAQWVQTNGPYGGNINCFAVIGSNFFAGTGDGVFLSIDSGKSWSAKNAGLTSTNIWTLATIAGTLFAGTDSGVFRSNGGDWVEASDGLNNTIINSMAVIGNILFVGTGNYTGADNNIFSSTDFGTNWREVNTAFAQGDAVGYLAACGISLYALTDYGAYRSTDSGASWSPSFVIGPFAVIDTTIFSIGSDSTGAENVFRSTDSGANWLPCGLEQDYVSTFAVVGTSLFVGSIYNVIYLTTDDGVTWTRINDSLGHLQALAAVGTNLFAGTSPDGPDPSINGGGVYRSTDSGKSWSFTSKGITNTDVFSLASRGSNLFAGTDGGGVLLSTDNGSTWTSSSLGLAGSIVMPLQVFDSDLFAGTDSVYRSTNNGASFFAANKGITNSDGNAPPEVFAVMDSNLFVGTWGNGIFRTTDNGAVWTSVNSGLPQNPYISGIVVSNSNLFVSCYANDSGGVFCSTDKGTGWSVVDNGLPSGQVTFIAGFGGNLFASPYGYGLFRSTDNGKNWTSSNNGLLDNSEITSFAVSGMNLFLVNGHGVFLSTDSGTSFAPINANLGIIPLSVLSLAVSDSYLFAGLQGAGVWRRPLSDFNNSAVAPVGSIHTSLTNYPNPFAQSTTIAFTVPESGISDISVVNTLGTEVARIYSGELSAGAHSFQWNARGLPVGMYVCVLRMNGVVQRVPMVVVRN